jgi:ATP-dependent DNA ligase
MGSGCWWGSIARDAPEWSRRGASLGDRLDLLLNPLVDAPRGSIFDAELVALSSRDGVAVQDFAAVCRAAIQADRAAAAKLHLVVFDLLELAGEDMRSLPWTERTELLREAFPAGDRLRLVVPRPASRAAHDQLVELEFEGAVLKRLGSTYRSGRQTAWRKYKASHRVTATLKKLRQGRDGNTYAISELDGRSVTTSASPQLADVVGHQVELAYSRIDADGPLREVRISAVDVDPG